MTVLPDALQEMLLARIAGDTDPTPVGPAPSPAQIIAGMLDGDPATAGLAAALRRRVEREAAAQQDAERTIELRADVEGSGALPEASPADPAHDPDGPTAAGDEVVVDVLERLYAEVEQLRARNRVLAAALGACPRCFGEDPHCRTCHGRGVPGGRRPDPALYDQLVRPAVARAHPIPTETNQPTTRESA